MEYQRFKEGDRAYYAPAARPPIACTITGVGEKNGHVVYDCKLDGEDIERWGYENWFKPIS